MKCLIFAVITATAVVASGSVYSLHPGVGAIFKGPNSETIIKGPDGSVITAEAIGGSVATEIKPEVVPLKPAVAVVEPVIVAAQSAIVSAGPNNVIADEQLGVTAIPTTLVDEKSVLLNAGLTYSSREPTLVLPPPQPETVVVETAPARSVYVDAVQTVPVVSGAVNFKNNPIVVEETVAVVPSEVVSVEKAPQSAQLNGPSGTIITEGENSVVAGPASTTITKGEHTAEIVPISPGNVVPIPKIASTIQVPIVQPIALAPLPAVYPVYGRPGNGPGLFKIYK